jgi:hypothetical protein
MNGLIAPLFSLVVMGACTSILLLTYDVCLQRYARFRVRVTPYKYTTRVR